MSTLTLVEQVCIQHRLKGMENSSWSLMNFRSYR
jgi:hypothetical protein